jgi:hypothetical protein
MYCQYQPRGVMSKRTPALWNNRREAMKAAIRAISQTLSRGCPSFAQKRPGFMLARPYRFVSSDLTPPPTPPYHTVFQTLESIEEPQSVPSLAAGSSPWSLRVTRATMNYACPLSFANLFLASSTSGMPGSASFHISRKASYSAIALLPQPDFS